MSVPLINKPGLSFHLRDVCRNPQDHDVQSMLGIKVNKTRETLPNVLVEYLGSARAGFQFSMLTRYHPIDVVALMEGVCPHQNSGYLFLLF
jgi:hypothetical protein